MYSREKNRSCSPVATLICVGLAFCVFAWGSQYKLSLYDPPQAASHQIPMAKLLSGNEQSKATEGLVQVRAKTSAPVMHKAPSVFFFILLLALTILGLPASGKREQRVNGIMHVRRAVLNTLFIRPPPALA